LMIIMPPHEKTRTNSALGKRSADRSKGSRCKAGEFEE
jgi:hypothetical protein